jgi:hypothetical protein
LADLRPFLFAVLANDLKVAQKALLDEKSAQLGVENSLAEEKAARQAAALFKNHLPDLSMELLRQDFTVDNAERETLVSNTIDAPQNFVSSYDFASLAESDDNDSPKAL